MPAEVILPNVVRCILQTSSMDDYRCVIGKPIGDFSLQDEIAKLHQTVELNQHLPATAEYPAMVVIDLTPATKCQLGAVATFVVVPPAPERREDKGEGTPNNTPAPAGEPQPYRSVEICLNRGLRGTSCVASTSVFEELLLEEDSFVRLGDAEYACTFVLSSAANGGAKRDELLIEASADLFRNIRAAFLHRPLSCFQSASLTFCDTSFYLPIDLLEPVALGDGAVLTLRHPSAKATTSVTKLLVSPALPDFILTNLLGEGYADLFSVLLASCAAQLNGRLVSEGDVITLRWDTALLQKTAVEGVAVLEAAYASLLHKVEHWDGVWTSERNGRPSFLAFRVVEVRKETAGSFGFVCVDGAASGAPTELALVSQSLITWADATPLYAPAETLRGSLEIEDTLRQCLGRTLLPRLRSHHATFVLHGIKENLPHRFVTDVLREFGVLSLCASAEALDSDELQLLLENFAQSSGDVALIIRNAQSLVAEHAHLLPLVDLPHKSTSGTSVVVLVCESLEAVPPAVAARATNVDGVIECGNPSEGDRKALLRSCVDLACRQYHLHASILLSFDALAAWTVGLPAADVTAYIHECIAAAVKPTYPAAAQPVISDQLCEELLQGYLKSHGHNLVSTKLQPVRWSDVGGLEDAKRELRETIQLPILHPELFANGMKKRTGILFYGPPGCGKTLLAKAVATEMNMNFMSVKGPELINQYVGESERNIRLLFQRARDNSPCIVFFDELDALAPARGAKGDAGGAMDRIVSQLLVEVDGVGQTRSDGTASGEVFIIGATNRPDLLDPSLLRPGRFDRLCYLGIPSNKEEQLYALKALTRKFDMASDVNFGELLEPLDYVYTGADFFALCSDAMMFSVEEALDKARAQIEHAVATGEDSPDDMENYDIRVSMDHFVRARDQLKPSVTKEDLKRYESLKAKFNK